MDKLGNKAIIGAGAEFSGTITDARAIEIHGKVNADLTADKVTIGEKGKFDGAVSASLVVVSGEYDGVMRQAVYGPPPLHVFLVRFNTIHYRWIAAH